MELAQALRREPSLANCPYEIKAEETSESGIQPRSIVCQSEQRLFDRAAYVKNCLYEK